MKKPYDRDTATAGATGDVNDAGTWAALLAETATAWQSNPMDAGHAEMLSEAYPRWQRLASASAALLPMDLVPADFDRLLAGSVLQMPIALRSGPTVAAQGGADPLSLTLTDATALLRSGAIGSRELTTLALRRLVALH